MYIDGKLIENHCKYSAINPATDEVIQEISVADKEVAEQALLAAKQAEKSWGKTPIAERVVWMNKLRDACIKNQQALRMAVHQETGKSWACTAEDYQSLIDSLAFYAEEIKRYTPPTIVDANGEFKHQLRHLPVGVVVAYLSWNFPLLNLGFKLGPAMASGCPIILKPSIKAPLSAYLVGQLCAEIGLPKGAVNIFAGNDREVGNYLSSSKIPQMLTLIGSISTGIKVMQAGATSIKRYSMELGGNTPFIVCEDADLDLAAKILCTLKYNNSGQICVAPNRIMVAKSIQQTLLEKVTQLADKVAVGYDIESDFVMGPVIDKWERDRIHALVEDAVACGATLVRGGTIDRDQAGAFYPPTILTNVTPQMKIYHQEIFGPVISIITIEEDQDVIAMANATDTGLASYIFSRDIGKAQRMAEELEFGEVQINGVKYGIDLPHVGIKQSGIGCDCSKFALDDYLYLARVTESC